MSHLQYCGTLEAFDKTALADQQPKRKNNYNLRTATPQDIPQICAISGSATKKFGSISELADLAEGQEQPLTVQKWLALGQIYLAEENGEPVGFIAAYPLDTALYVAEISTLESHQGRGVGSTLLDAVFQWALLRTMQDGAVTARVSLTTYPNVPWNGPWYRKRGFREVEASVVGPWHIEKMTTDEQERHLVRDGYPRCCMLWEADPPRS